MDSIKNQNLTEFSRYLRKNMTRHERHLWYDFLKNLPVMVHRQKVIGSYIVDFYIAEKNWSLNWTDLSTMTFPENRPMVSGTRFCMSWG